MTLCGLTLSVSLAIAQGQAGAKLPVHPNAGTPQSLVLYGPNFGTSTLVWQKTTAPEFDPDSTSTTYTSTWNPGTGSFVYQRWVTGGFPHLVASPHLPGGAFMTAISISYCDTNSVGQHLLVDMYDCDAYGGNCAPMWQFNSGAFPGCPMVNTAYGYFNYTVDNLNRQLLFDVTFQATDGSNTLTAVALGYSLQVSPPPATATFNDVPTGHPYFQFVEALAAAGITAGCGGGNYCPDNPLTRGQMAVFLAKALGLNWSQ
jgi:hypothetical protein